MKKFRWQLLIILLTGLVVGLLLFFQQSGTPSAPKVENTPSPIEGGIYTEALVGNFLRLNPMLDVYNKADRDVNRLLFNSLIKFDSFGSPKPDLADAWSFSPDGTLFTFTLRPDVYWHDGMIFGTQDVMYTISLLKSGSTLVPPDLAKFWSEVQAVALSDNTIQFSLPETFTPFLDYLSFQILPAHLLGNLTLDQLVDHPYNLAPIGTGPYQFKELIVDEGKISGVHLEVYEGYYAGSSFIKEIFFYYYPDDSAALAAYQAGEVDGISQVTTATLPSALAQADLNVYSTREPRLSIVFLNLKNDAKPFLQEPGVRQALMYAINRREMIDNLLMGQAIPANGPILPGNWAYFQDQRSFGYDPDAARQLFAGAGLTAGEESPFLRDENGNEIRLILLTQDDETHLKVAELIQKNWQEVGVVVDVLPKPLDEVQTDLEAHAFEAALVDIDLSGTPDPDPYPFWGQAMAQGGQNYAQWDNRNASNYLEQARVQMDQDMRAKLYRNFQVIFQDELPSLPLYYPIYNYAVRNTILNVTIGPIYEAADRFNNINVWYILAGKNPAATTDQP